MSAAVAFTLSVIAHYVRVRCGKARKNKVEYDKFTNVKRNEKSQELLFASRTMTKKERLSLEFLGNSQTENKNMVLKIMT